MQDFYSFILSLCDKVGSIAASLQTNPVGGVLMLGLGALVVWGLTVWKKGQRRA